MLLSSRLHSRPPRRRMRTTDTWVVAALASLAAVSIVACTAPEDDSARAPTGCAAAVASASRAAEVDEQVRLLDVALIACRSYDSFVGEMARYPGIVGFEVPTFVSVRCGRVDDDLVRTSPTCATVITPTTTVPLVTLPDLVFVGDTLDGRRVEIRPSATIVFVGEVPAVVQQTVDITLESGCEGLIAQRDLWAARADDPRYGDEASVYARHAQNVADYIQCDSPPLPSG